MQNPQENERILQQSEIDAAIAHGLTGQQPESDRDFVPTVNMPDGTFVLQSDGPLDTLDQDQGGRLKQAKDRVGRVLHEAHEDLNVDDSIKRKRIAQAWLGSAAVAQGIDRTRFVILYGPKLAIDTYERTGNSLTSAAVLTGIFAVANFLVGESLTQAMDRFPKAKESFQAEYPKTVQLFNDGLGGLGLTEKNDEASEITEATEATSNVDENEESEIEMKKVTNPEATPERNKLKAIAKKIVGKPIKNAKIAGVGIGLGSTAFVATASINGHDKKSIRALNAQVTAATSALIYGLAVGFFEGVKWMYMQGTEGWINTADFIDRHAKDSKTWFGVAALLIASNYVSNKRAKNKMTDI